MKNSFKKHQPSPAHHVNVVAVDPQLGGRQERLASGVEKLLGADRHARGGRVPLQEARREGEGQQQGQQARRRRHFDDRAERFGRNRRRCRRLAREALPGGWRAPDSAATQHVRARSMRSPGAPCEEASSGTAERATALAQGAADRGCQVMGFAARWRWSRNQPRLASPLPPLCRHVGAALPPCRGMPESVAPGRKKHQFPF